MRFDFGVLGGGLCGLACAWRLAQSGARVAIFDARHAEAATDAAAGMLAAQCEMAHHAPAQNAAEYFALCLRSRALYPDFLAQLQHESETSLMLQRGIRYVQTRADDNALAALRAGRAAGHQARETEYGRFPALLLPDEGAVEPRAIAAALRIALGKRGATFFAGETTPDDILKTCNDVLVCGGAWSARVLAASVPPENSANAANCIRPVAGTTVEARSDAINQTLYASDCYVVPRGDGRIVIGATSEAQGFDAAPTIADVSRLMQAATALEPALEAARVVAWRSGLRPVSRDGLPIVGALAEHLFFATGHGRNGVLLAPATAHIVADELCKGASAPEFLSPHRLC